MMITKTSLVSLTLFFFVANSLAQTPDACTAPGKYCYADLLYECINEEPKLVEVCPSGCENGECINGTIFPGIAYQEPVEQAGASNSDVILIISLSILGIFVLFLIWNTLSRRKQLRKETN